MTTTPVRSIVTHQRPHLDEICAIWLLRKFGEEKFPGVSQAKISFNSDGGTLIEGQSAADYERDGILLIGVSGGRFDEHSTADAERKKGDCAATLMAKALELDGDRELQKILKYVLTNDLRGTGQQFDLAYLIKVLHQQYPNDSMKVVEWAFLALEAKYQEQLQFWTSTREEFERLAQVEEISGPRGRKFKMVTVSSDNEQMSKFARSVHGGSAAIVIIKKSSGRVQIFTNKKYELSLYDVTQMIRLAEQKAKKRVVTYDWKALAAAGKVEGAEEWYFHPEMQFLHNGSLTASDVPPTNLSLERIQEIVRIGINPYLFEPGRRHDCQRGICTSTRSEPCPWYDYGLRRCRKIRLDMRQRNEAKA